MISTRLINSAFDGRASIMFCTLSEIFSCLKVDLIDPYYSENRKLRTSENSQKYFEIDGNNFVRNGVLISMTFTLLGFYSNQNIKNALDKMKDKRNKKKYALLRIREVATNAFVARISQDSFPATSARTKLNEFKPEVSWAKDHQQTLIMANLYLIIKENFVAREDHDREVKISDDDVFAIIAFLYHKVLNVNFFSSGAQIDSENIRMRLYRNEIHKAKLSIPDVSKDEETRLIKFTDDLINSFSDKQPKYSFYKLYRYFIIENKHVCNLGVLLAPLMPKAPGPKPKHLTSK